MDGENSVLPKHGYFIVRNCLSQKDDQLGLCFRLGSINQEESRITLTKILTRPDKIWTDLYLQKVSQHICQK